MVVCKYFQQGTCRFGERCKYEHPGAGQGPGQGAGFASQNRFGVFQSPGGQNTGNSNSPLGGGVRRETPYGLNSVDIRNDLSAGKGRPQWILSSYGPGKNPPASLLEGNELSFEELRVRHYQLQAAGNEQQAIQEAGSLYSKAESDMKNVVDNVEAAMRYIEDAENKHPNRHDICKRMGDPTLASSRIPSGIGQTPLFGQAAQPSPSVQATSGTAFGQSSFGKPSQPTAFGQPSFGQPSQPTTSFGQPSQPSSAFGQPSQPAGVFGKPSQPSSAFGQPSQPSSAFGQPSQPTSAFGQPSKPSGFGQPSFGQPSAPAAGSPFGGQQPTTVFGQPSKPSPFGQPSLSQPTQPSGFGQPSQSSPFGQPSQVSGFGQPSQSSPFGQPSQPASQSTPAFGSTPSGPATNPFGQPSQPTTQSTSAFGAPSTSAPAPAFGQPAATSGFGPAQSSNTATPTAAAAATGTRKHVPLNYPQTLSGPTNRDGSKRLTTFRGRPVKYFDSIPHYSRPDGQGWERIWFPDGPTQVQAREVDGTPEQYTDEVKQAWDYVFETGKFKDGKMPTVPPLREWASCDF